MEPVFFTRSKGRVRKMLAVYSDGQQYKLQFTVLDRTNPTREERTQGIKEKRFETLNEEYYVNISDVIKPDKYPLQELTLEFINFLNGKKMMITEKPSPEQVTTAREAAGLSLSEAAQHFGMVYNAWQKKENKGTTGTKLSVGEYNYLLLLANQHPDLIAVHRLPADKTPQQEAAQAALDLARYLAAGAHSEVVLPTVVDAMFAILQQRIQAVKNEWDQDLPLGDVNSGAKV